MFPRKTINIIAIQVYVPTTNAKEAEVEWFYEDLQGLPELTPKKEVLFIIGDWNAEIRSQEIPGVTGKFEREVQDETGQMITELKECTGHKKHSLPTTQRTILHMDIAKWSISN